MKSLLKKLNNSMSNIISNSILARNETLGTIESYCPKCETTTVHVWKVEGAWEKVVCLSCGKTKWF